MLPDDDGFSDALKTNSLTTTDDDEIDDNVDNINCKYYACDEFFTHNNSNSFNILHSNVNGLIYHADNINEFLAHCESTNFDAICITESSLHQDADIPNNVLPNGYEHISTETLGGVTIFVKKTTLKEMTLKFKQPNLSLFGLK